MRALGALLNYSFASDHRSKRYTGYYSQLYNSVDAWCARMDYQNKLRRWLYKPVVDRNKVEAQGNLRFGQNDNGRYFPRLGRCKHQ